MDYKEYNRRVNAVWEHLRNTPTRKEWKTRSWEILWLLACAESGEKDPDVIAYGKMMICNTVS